MVHGGRLSLTGTPMCRVLLFTIEVTECDGSELLKPYFSNFDSQVISHRTTCLF